MPRAARIMPELSAAETAKLLARLSKYSQRDATTGCLVWHGCVRGRYGHITIKHVGYAAHRVAFEVNKHALRADESICHSCDNPLCIEPSHLFPGSHTDNMRDMTAKGRSSAILSPEAVREIRQRLAAGELQKTLASEFGVKQPAISNLHRGVSWETVS